MGPDGAAQAWQLRTGDALDIPVRDGGAWEYTCFSPDSKLLLAGNGAGARLWDLQTGHIVSPTFRHGTRIVAAAFHKDGRQFATVSGAGTVRIWALRQGPDDEQSSPGDLAWENLSRDEITAWPRCWPARDQRQATTGASRRACLARLLAVAAVPVRANATVTGASSTSNHTSVLTAAFGRVASPRPFLPAPLPPIAPDDASPALLHSGPTALPPAVSSRPPPYNSSDPPPYPQDPTHAPHSPIPRLPPRPVPSRRRNGR